MEETGAGNLHESRAAVVRPAQPFHPRLSLHENSLNLKLSCNKVYYTACSLLVMYKNSCSKPHCRDGFDSIPFSCQMQGFAFQDGFSAIPFESNRMQGGNGSCHILDLVRFGGLVVRAGNGLISQLCSPNH